MGRGRREVGCRMLLFHHASLFQISIAFLKTPLIKHNKFLTPVPELHKTSIYVRPKQPNIIPYLTPEDFKTIPISATRKLMQRITYPFILGSRDKSNHQNDRHNSDDRFYWDDLDGQYDADDWDDRDNHDYQNNQDN